MVQVLEVTVLQPTVGYLQAYQDTGDDGKNRDLLYDPVFSTCDLLGPKTETSTCTSPQKRSRTSTRIARSKFNPGEGSLLSADVALALARDTQIIAPWMTVMSKGGTEPLRVMTADEVNNISKDETQFWTRHLRALQRSVDALDINIAQAQVLSGVPSLVKAAEVLSNQIIPAYAQARLRGSVDRLNELLPFREASEGKPPNCTTKKEAWDTICLMQTNPLFAANVIKMVVTERLAKKNVTWSEWRRALRSPLSQPIQELIGSDVILSDAARDVPSRLFGAWSIELPRVNSRPLAQAENSNCWTAAVPVPDRQKQPGFYATNASGRCYMLDGFREEQFINLAQVPLFGSLVQERAFAASLISKYCAALEYQEGYCGQQQ